jgi:hypothetical protein
MRIWEKTMTEYGMKHIESLAENYFLAESIIESTLAEWKAEMLSLPKGTPRPTARNYPNTAKLLELLTTPPTE